ncbi:MAG: GH116 family glycosyl hydrolase [Ignavibacteriales bacterium]|nr:GH116 family glycosyl hydrolase [Ignavibacteriales bacterium]
MKKIAFLIVDPHTLNQEEHSAWSFVSRLKTFRAEKVLFSALDKNPRSLLNFDLAWWHFDESLELPEIATNDSTIRSIRAFLSKGRGLLLSLASAQYVVDLGLESIRPNICVSGLWEEKSWAEGHPDTRGFGAFGQHPIFKGFSGGTFTSAPDIGRRYTAAYYEDQLPAAGRVVAVEKLYIKLDEQRRNVIEHSLDAGRIVSIGSHFYFSDSEQRFRRQLEHFASNCFSYLSTPTARKSEKVNERIYWDFSLPTVAEFSHRSKPLSVTSHKLPTRSDELVIHRDFAAPDLTEQFFDLSGRRVLIMGGERGGISEIWCHPVRILDNLKIQFRVGKALPQWSHELSPVVTICPESLTRRYNLNDATIEETLFADLLKPCGAIHYSVRSRKTVQIVLSARIDLRTMWPLSDRAIGSRRFAWDEAIHAGIITDASGQSSSILGSSRKPTDHLIGQYSEIVLEGDRLKGLPTESSAVALGFRVSLNSGARQCTIAFAGSGQSMQESIQSYRSVVQRPGPSLGRQRSRLRSVLRSSVRFATPSEQVNNAYRWAIAGLDKFVVEAPLLGRSFVAGYGLSSEGWNGGHTISGRPGYAWYFGRDSVWTGLAALACGEHEIVRDVLEFLGNYQDIDGKVLHELTTSGYAHYDAADSTPLYLVLMGRYVRATGDREFAASEFSRLIKAIEYCYSTDTDNDHLIENANVGHGWVEGGQLFPSHAEHYLNACWAEALLQSSFMAELLSERRLGRKWNEKAELVRTVLKREFWNPRTGFYNFSKCRDGSFVEEKTVLPSVGMYFKCTEHDKAQHSLAEYSGDNFSSDWGVRIVGKDNRFFNPTGYHYGSIWPLFTGWTSLAEFTNLRPLQGYMHLLSNALLYDQFSAGNMEEVLHGEVFRPVGVCPHQAWSQSMVIQPLIEGLLGLETDVIHKTVHMSPYFPPDWREASVKNIRLGDHRMDLDLYRKEKETVFVISLRRYSNKSRPSANYSLSFRPFFSLGTFIERFTIGSTMHNFAVLVDDYRALPTVQLQLGRKTVVRVEHKQGLALIPAVPHFQHGQKSKGVRVVNESWRNKSYVLTLEGKPGEDSIIEVLDRSRTARSVEGARVLAHDGDHLILAVPFEGDQSAGSYVRKDVVVNT